MPGKTITCKACSYAENEAERVYCRNCGAKLDRRHVPKATGTARAERRRLLSLTHRRPAFFGPLLRGSIEAALFGALAAATALVFFAPPDPPAPVTDEERLDPPKLSIEIETALMADQPYTITIGERAINTYFDAHIRSRDRSPLGFQFRFERAFVRLEPGVCHIFMVRSIAGVRLYTRASYALGITARGLESTSMGGGVGRLRLHPIAMFTLEGSFRPLWKTLNSERRLLGRLASIEVEQGRIVMISRPNAL